MLYDRLTNFHKLNNLLWVFNANEVRTTIGPYKDYFPGNDVVDILATDVYSQKYSMDDYRQLLELGGGKPIALGEVGDLPPLDVLKKQPRWVWFMHWGDPETLLKDWDYFKKVFDSERVLVLDELPWVKVKSPKIHHPILH